eukprot:TRINITY_DN10149_c0_g1_i1.p1 TRINITY_DN10149_c0_g1~~TRINITY_DN10149_c0_g1_i1.p1  ORF type:complete len:1029 (+),score=234.80 TRINITY_DN10149_c0_g1_i1:25-3111(+)
MDKSLHFGEPDTPHNFICDQNGEIIQLSFSKLIEKITVAEAASSLIDQFLLTYRSICDAEELMGALIQRFTTTEDAVVRLRCINIWKTWLKQYAFDFIKDKNNLKPMFLEFFGQVQFKEEFSQLMRPLNQILALVNDVDDQGNITAVPKFTTMPPKPLLPKNVVGELDFTDMEPLEIARQMTLIEYDMWVVIPPWEFLGQAWAKKDRVTRAPNICRMIDRFNLVSGWVATTIVRVVELRERIKTVQKFIEIAEHLRDLNNFNAVLEIISGINSSSIHRLKKTFEGIGKNYARRLENLQELVSQNGNYDILRTTLHSCIPPCIPYLGVYLTDLTFIEEGHSSKTERGLINWVQRHQISRVIIEVKQYQDMAYNLTSTPSISDYLVNLEHFTEETTYDCSQYIEPRNEESPPDKPYELLSSEERSAAGLSGSLNDFDIDYPPDYPFKDIDSVYNIKIRYDDNSRLVIGGTLEKLVERLTFDKYSEPIFVNSFFVSYRRFCTPDDLMDLLEMRYNFPGLKASSKEMEDEYNSYVITPIRLRVFSALKLWVDKHFYDFTPELLERLEDFIRMIARFNSGWASMLSTSVDNMVGNKVPVIDINAAPPRKGTMIFKPVQECTSLDFDPEEIARQMCLIDYRLFIEIRPPELLNNVHNDCKGYAVNLYRYINRIEKVAYVIETEIRSCEDTITVQYIIRWISVIENLVEMRNWNGVKSVVEGLSRVYDENPSSPWNMVPLDKRDYFSTVKNDLENNGENLFERIIDESKETPYLPVMDILIKKIQALEKLPLMRSDTMINFERDLQVADVVLKSIIIKQHGESYKFHPVNKIQDWLTSDDAPDLVEYLEALEGPSDIYAKMSSLLKSSGIPKTTLLPGEDKPVFVPPAKDNVFNLFQNDEDLRNILKGLIRESIREDIRNISSKIVPINISRVIVEQFPGCNIKRWKHFDANGSITGTPKDIYVDIIEKGRVHYIYKSQQVITPAEILYVARLGEYYKSFNTNIITRCILITRYVTPNVDELATEFNIDILQTYF